MIWTISSSIGNTTLVEINTLDQTIIIIIIPQIVGDREDRMVLGGLVSHSPQDTGDMQVHHTQVRHTGVDHSTGADIIKVNSMVGPEMIIMTIMMTTVSLYITDMITSQKAIRGG